MVVSECEDDGENNDVSFSDVVLGKCKQNFFVSIVHCLMTIG